MNIVVLDVKLRGYHSGPLYLGEDDLQMITSCPACGQGPEQVRLAVTAGDDIEALHVSHCGACAHIYLSRRPRAQWYQRYYSTEWDTGRSKVSVDKEVRGVKLALKRSTAVTRVIRATRVLRRDLPELLYPWPARFLHLVAGLGEVSGDEFPRGKKLLEIGSGYGAALSFLKDAGLETHGTEASERRVEACRAQGLDVVQTSINDLSPVASAAPFDFIFSSHVFEHLTDLDPLMSQLHPLLAEGGFLYLEVPHGPLAEDIILRSHIPVHCHIFSARSLSALMKRFGFRPVRVLADVSLHIVAQKTENTTAIEDVDIPSPPEDLLHGLDIVANEQDPLEVRYNQFEVLIRRASDGLELFRRPFPYGSVRLDDSDLNEFTIRIDKGSKDGIWPLRFNHPGPQAPIFVKNQ